MLLPTPISMDLTGKTALVTGASSGIGQGCAVALANAGAHVVCVARGAERLNQTVEAMKENGWSAEAVALDQADLISLRKLIGEHSLDIVVNSAGVALHNPALETSEEDFDAVMSVNLKSAYFLSSIAAANMIARERHGSIIHISSQMGHVGGIERALYCATKHGVEGMVKAMAIEWGKKGIRINTISPTFIRTPLTQSTFDNPGCEAWIMEKIKVDRVGEVEDIMGAVVYLASDASAMVTGTSLLVDGGWTAG